MKTYSFLSSESCNFSPSPLHNTHPYPIHLYIQSHAHATKSQTTPPHLKHRGLQLIVQLATNHSSSWLSKTMSLDGTSNDLFNDIPYLPLSYSNADSQTSALRLILTLFPDWEHSDGKIEFIRFKDGITNTVCLCGLRSDFCREEEYLLITVL